MYSYSEQVEYLVDYIKKIDYELYWCRKEAKTVNDDYAMLLETQEKIIEKMEYCRLFFKSEAFANEQEYRFVLRIPEHLNKTKALLPGFTRKEGVFTPYYDLEISENIIENIMISPMLEKELAKKGLKIFLKRQGMENININNSGILVRY